MTLAPEGAEADPNYGTAKSAVNNVYRMAEEGEAKAVIVTGETGMVNLSLPDGTYILKEVDAPDGYLLTGEEIRFTVQNGEVFDSDGHEAGHEGGPLPYEKLYTFTVKNKAGTELPQTGGLGTEPLVCIGAMLLAIGCTGLWVKKRKECDSRTC